jgi:hypothetical protein
MMRVRTPTRAVLAILFALVSSNEPTARANGRFPAASQLVARPGDPSRLLLRTTYGLLTSSDGGTSWDWMCERAVGYGGNDDPSIAITGSGAFVVGMFNGSARSLDGGCTWLSDPKGPRGIVDIALRSNAPDRLYAVTSQYSRAGDAGALFDAKLLVSDDAGEHWSVRAMLDPTLLLDSVEVAPSDPKRIYISAIRPRGEATRGVLLTSNDDGVHFTESAVAFTPADRGVYIGAVDPNRADRVYLRTSAVDATRLRVSDDAGKTSRVVFDGGALLGFALSEDGATIYAGGPKEGVLAASASDTLFTKRSPQPVQCLTSIGSALWACAPTTSGFVLGASMDGAATFDARLKIAGMRGPLRCKGPSAIDSCAADWAALRRLVGFDDHPDAAPPPATSPPPAPQSSACRCSTPGHETNNAAAIGAMLLGVILFFARAHRTR